MTFPISTDTKSGEKMIKYPKNDFCGIYPAHKWENYGVKKTKKKRHAVFGTLES